MELSTLILTIVIVLPFFIQFHYLLEDPWILCRAFHYYSSKSRHRIQKAPRLIVHYPKRQFPSNSLNSINISETSFKNIESKIENEKIINNNLQDEISLDYSSSSIETVNNEISSLLLAKNINNNENFGKCLERKIYGQSQSYTPMMLNNFQQYNSTNNNNPKDINVKSGCTDLIHDKHQSLDTNNINKNNNNNNNNANVEFLYSRDLFLFEYRKRPNVKSEGTQSDNRKTGSSRIFRF
ncbi:retinoblastoma-like protein A [Leptopilina boulardi]|uniref:retinoblastoma-like protein A n=1 Tax=Leptopilina boulardi TaxID=63433 RepID=UPI0021F60719|nr:retinoblastoma-like protein A [Leptopilina boulardi]